MRRAEQLHEEILAQMDLSKEASDEELLELIHRILEEKSKEEFIPLGEKAILGRELFNAFRKLDILQELIEDEEITEIMINGTQPIFIERNGRIYETDKKFLSKLHDAQCCHVHFGLIPEQKYQKCCKVHPQADG